MELAAAFVRVGVDTSGLKGEMDKARGIAESGAKGIGAAFDRLGTKLTGLGTIGVGAAAAITAPLAAAVASFVATGDALGDMSERTGVAAETLSALGYAAQMSGADIDAVGQGFRGLNRFMLDVARSGSTSVDTLARLGVTAEQLQRATPEERFLLLAEALSKVEDASERGGLAMQVFGRGGEALLPLLNSGAEGIRKLTDEAHRMGAVMSDEDVAAAQALDDAMVKLKASLAGAKNQVGAALVPAITELVNEMTPLITHAVTWISQNRDLVVWIGKTAATVGVLSAGMFAVGKAASAATLGMTAFQAMSTALATKSLPALITQLVTARGLMMGLATAGMFAVKGLEGPQQILDRIQNGRPETKRERILRERAEGGDAARQAAEAAAIVQSGVGGGAAAKAARDSIMKGLEREAAADAVQTEAADAAKRAAKGLGIGKGGAEPAAGDEFGAVLQKRSASFTGLAEFSKKLQGQLTGDKKAEQAVVDTAKNTKELVTQIKKLVPGPANEAPANNPVRLG